MPHPGFLATFQPRLHQDRPRFGRLQSNGFTVTQLHRFRTLAQAHFRAGQCHRELRYSPDPPDAGLRARRRLHPVCSGRDWPAPAATEQERSRRSPQKRGLGSCAAEDSPICRSSSANARPAGRIIRIETDGTAELFARAQHVAVQQIGATEMASTKELIRHLREHGLQLATACAFAHSRSCH